MQAPLSYLSNLVLHYSSTVAAPHITHRHSILIAFPFPHPKFSARPSLWSLFHLLDCPALSHDVITSLLCTRPASHLNSSQGKTSFVLKVIYMCAPVTALPGFLKNSDRASLYFVFPLPSMVCPTKIDTSKYLTANVWMTTYTCSQTAKPKMDSTGGLLHWNQQRRMLIINLAFQHKSIWITLVSVQIINRNKEKRVVIKLNEWILKHRKAREIFIL